MNENNYTFLSKSTVNTPSYSKSPAKYVTEYTPSVSAVGSEKPTSSSWKEWKPSSDYQNVARKIPQDYSSLRQTFDARTNSKLQEKLTQYKIHPNDKNNQEQKPGSQALRQTFHTTIPSPTTSKPSLAQSTALERVYKKEEPTKLEENKFKNRKSQNNEKIQNYLEMFEKFKDELETTKKVSQQIKKLKQDRRKRLQAKEKQDAPVDQQQPTETFRKKNYYECYTPKNEKGSYHERFQVNKIGTSSFHADKYPQSDKVEKEYKSPISSDISSPMSPPLSAVKRRSSKFQELSGRERKYSSIGIGKVRMSDFNQGKSLGEGKFGVVYQASHKATGFLYAIKKVPKDMIKSHLMVDQFILELKLQTFLNHQNILALYGHFDDDSHIYLILEYMEEGTLFTHLKKNKVLPEKDVAVSIRQIASAVKYLHENNIAHRDIKPENIVMSHGVCKLCDFGWATVCDDRRKTYCGTFDYAPPEILEGIEYDFTVDLWCLGVLTYELLVGKAPFYHISRKETMKRILNVENTMIEYPEHISKNAVSFIDNLIRKNPKQRMSSDVILEHPFLKNADKL